MQMEKCWIEYCPTKPPLWWWGVREAFGLVSGNWAMSIPVGLMSNFGQNLFDRGRQQRLQSRLWQSKKHISMTCLLHRLNRPPASALHTPTTDILSLSGQPVKALSITSAEEGEPGLPSWRSPKLARRKKGVVKYLEIPWSHSWGQRGTWPKSRCSILPLNGGSWGIGRNQESTVKYDCCSLFFSSVV